MINKCDYDDDTATAYIGVELDDSVIASEMREQPRDRRPYRTDLHGAFAAVECTECNNSSPLAVRNSTVRSTNVNARNCSSRLYFYTQCTNQQYIYRVTVT